MVTHGQGKNSVTDRVRNLQHCNTQRPLRVPKIDMAPHSSRSQSFPLRKNVKDEDGTHDVQPHSM